MRAGLYFRVDKLSRGFPVINGRASKTDCFRPAKVRDTDSMTGCSTVGLRVGDDVDSGHMDVKERARMENARA